MSTRDQRTSPAGRGGRRGLPRWAACAACALLLAGCQVLPERPPLAATYDLGAGERGTLAHALAPARVAVSAPAWLQATSMHYRVLHGDPARRRAYADNRWAAQPAAMLALVLERRLGAGEGGGCRLQVQLDEFEQLFHAADRSEARLVARFALFPVRGNKPLASAALSVLEAAPTADARGGAAAFRVATDRLADGIAQWLTDTDRALPGGLAGEGRCRR